MLDGTRMMKLHPDFCFTNHARFMAIYFLG
jgi:hypothetical protein